MWRSAVQLRAGLRFLRGYSSVGRAPALQAGGQEFESLYLHGDFQTVAILRLSFFVYAYMMSPFLCLHSPLPPEDLKADWHHTRRMGRFDGQYSIATASSAVLRICAHIADKSGKRHKRIFGRADILGGKIQVCRSMEPPRHGR